MAHGIQLQNQSLAKIMNSASFGVISSSGEGNLKKSALFEGLAIIRSKFSDDYKKTNVQARTEFVNTLIKEFGFDPTDVSALKLKRVLCEGSAGDKPLSIRDAQKIIKGLATYVTLNREKNEENKAYNQDSLNRLALQTLEDPKMFREDIGIASRGVLKNHLISIRDKAGDNAMPEMLKIVEDWLKLGGTEPKKGLAEAVLKELVAFDAPKTKLEQEYEEFGVEVRAMRENDYSDYEVMEYAHAFAERHKLDTDDISLRSLLSRFS